jgi:hypothetical protein
MPRDGSMNVWAGRMWGRSIGLIQRMFLRRIVGMFGRIRRRWLGMGELGDRPWAVAAGIADVAVRCEVRAIKKYAEGTHDVFVKGVAAMSENTGIEQCWIDAWNDLFDIVGDADQSQINCLLPDGSIVDFGTCQGWLQESAYEGYCLKVEAGWVSGKRGIVVSRFRDQTSRSGWDTAFAGMAAQGDDRLLDTPTATEWEQTEWEW